ncbi:MAG: hypothetical protein ACI9KE_002825 [Polyangiales bacterium]
MSHVLLKPPQLPQPPKVTPPQETPLVVRLHERDSLEVAVPQLPPLHVGVITLRLCVPVVSQVLEKPPQLPQAPFVTLPHDAPLVVRLHERDSLVVTVSQLPLLQLGVMMLRLCVPVVSHELEKPPQLPQAPVAALPHDVPFVLLVHERDSLDVTVEQPPPLQLGVITLRL